MTTERISLARQERGAWLATISAFVFGDIFTTYFGLQGGSIELHPVARAILAYGVPGMILAKVLVFLTGAFLFFYGYRVIPGAIRDHRIVIPVTLAAWGIFLLIWNAEIGLGILDPVRVAVEYIEQVSLLQ